MSMELALVQMDMALGKPDENFAHARELIKQAAAGAPDVILLPETWNVGFFPKEDLAALADVNEARVTAEIGALAKELGVNIVAGSVANVRDGRVFNTSVTFDRRGNAVNVYDKTHLFSPMGEHGYFTPGARVQRFTLDGFTCGVIICYDIRFPELTRTMSVQGLDFLFVVSQWPAVRVLQLKALLRARAIENQCFACVCNSCGTAGTTVYGGNSLVFDPLGEQLAEAGTGEEILFAECDPSGLAQIRESINVFRDRRPELYHV